MAKTIVSCNEKGGVGKSTIVACCSTILSERGYTCLLVDMDPQGDLNIMMNIPNHRIDIFEVLMKNMKLRLHRLSDTLFSIPGTEKMYDFEVEYKHKYSKTRHEMALKKTLEELQNEVDFIFIDCPPNIKSIMVDNAFCAGDYVLIPAEAQATSYAGVERVLNLIKEFNQEFNPELKPLGIVMSMVDTRTNLYKGAVSSFRDKYGDLVMETEIRDVTAVKEVNTLKEATITTIDEIKLKDAKVKILKENRGLQDFNLLCDEILKKLDLPKEIK